MAGASSGRLGEVRAAAARVGHGGHEHLVEALAEPDGGGANALALGGAARQAGQHDWIGETDVRHPVGQEQHAAGACVGREPTERLGALQPAAGQVGVTARVDLFDGGAELLAVGADLRQRRAELDLVVVGDDRQVFGGGEALEKEPGAPARHLDLAPGHRSGAVDHSGHRAAAGGRRSRVRRER